MPRIEIIFPPCVSPLVVTSAALLIHELVATVEGRVEVDHPHAARTLHQAVQKRRLVGPA